MAPVNVDDFTRLRKFSIGTSQGFVVPPVGKAFVGAVVLNALLILSYRLGLLAALSADETAAVTTDHVWFFALTLETTAFMLYFAADAVRSENHYELLAFLACAVVLGARSVLEFFAVDTEVRAAERLCVCVLREFV